MLNILKAAVTGTAFTLAIVLSGGLVLVAALAWQAYSDPFFDKEHSQ